MEAPIVVVEVDPQSKNEGGPSVVAQEDRTPELHNIFNLQLTCRDDMTSVQTSKRTSLNLHIEAGNQL